jgi:hypothetical protein
MVKKVKFEAFDDLDARKKQWVEAAKCDQPLTWGRRAVSLDLSEAHWKAIDEFLRPYLEAGTPLKSPRASDSPKTSKAPDSPNLPEAQAQAAVKPPGKRTRPYLYERLTVFAEAHGLPKPHQIKKSDGTKSWNYPRNTLARYNAAQAKEAENALSGSQPE